MTEVSFIIPSYNSSNTILRTLKSIYGLKSLGAVKDVIVVDSSEDGVTRKVLKDPSASPQDDEVMYQNDGGGGWVGDERFRCVLLDTKTSPGLGRNIGVEHARGEILCFIDSDVYLDENWLECILRAYESGCLVGSGSVSLPKEQQHSKLALAQLYLQFNETLCVGEPRAVPLVPSCNMFCQKELFLRAGGFPKLRASEDTMFCLALTGISQIWFVPQARAFHIFREDWGGFKRNQVLLGQYISIYRQIYYKKWYYKGLFPVLLLPGFLVIKSVRITLRLLKAGREHFLGYLRCVFIYKLGLYYWSCGFIKGCLSSDENIRH